METLLIITHILVSLFLIAIVLLQHGKGADIGATFGGSGQSLFGTEGPVPLLNKITTVSAIIFMGTSISLAYLSANRSTGSVMSELPVQEAAAPAKEETPVTIPMPGTEKQVEEIEKAEPAPVVQQSEATTEAEPIAPEDPVNESVEPETVPAEQQTAPVEQETETTPEQGEVE
ncbi:MAG: preprotein translocase subunit SecG [Candidatus Electrothrix sp. YB6]